jgi:hypothetical protein
MNTLCARGFLVAALLTAWPGRLPAQSTAASGTQTTTPATQQPAPKPKPKKKPDEPIDPDTTAGVRGPGTTHTVRVLLKGKPAVGAHVVVKNTNGTLAASCFTNDSGECQVDVGADSYVLSATEKDRAGSVSLAVTDATGPIVIKLAKIKPAVKE